MFSGLLMGVSTALNASGQTNFSNAPLLAAALKVVFFPTILGGAVIWVAMWYFWFGVDRSHWAKRAVWFAALFFLPPSSSALYYFLVYRRLVLSERDREAQLRSAAASAN
ncbi:MAG TPA: hypothetical protein VFA76_17645 [Terriglobales bacterium]|nr:hypothetical protein [Terriglobales bacterium]